MISLTVGGTVLNLHSGIFWVNQFSEPRIAEDEFMDIDGGVCVQQTQISGGRPIIFEAKGTETSARSYWTQAQIEQIEAWEISGETIAVVYGSKNFNVRVPSKPFSVTPLRDMEGHTADDIYFGTITFKEVL